jgi:SAM-dependent methyltransferase
VDHADVTRDQFTRQADGFASARAMDDGEALAVLVEAAAPVTADRALDVACGPGIVVAALAPHVAEATGIDLTPRMIELARERCAEFANVAFEIGPARPLPFADAAFSLVVCRYALHHFEDPAAAIAEMARVCEPGGRLVLIDQVVGDDPEEAARLNEVEIARDPSHTRALPPAEIVALAAAAGLDAEVVAGYSLPMEVEAILARSASPDPDAVRELFSNALDDGVSLGLAERREGDKIVFAFPVSVVVARKQ